MDAVVEDLVRGNHLLMDVARGLGVSPERADRLMICKVGSPVVTNDILAGPVGLARRIIRAPYPGKVVHIGHGQVLLELAGQPGQLKAGLPGEVIDLLPERGVIVKAYGALVQGVWGNGKIGEGKIKVNLDSLAQELTLESIDSSMAGAICVSGYCSDLAVFSAAVDKKLGGIVLAGLHPSLTNLATQIDIPVLLIEGFGCHALNPSAFEILAANQDQFAALNAEPWDAWMGTRPELVIHQTRAEDSNKPVSIGLFAPGKRVRLIGSSQLGRLGVLVDFIGQFTFPNGLQAVAASVKLDSGEILNFPLANLEIVS